MFRNSSKQRAVYFIGFCDVQLDFLVKIMVTVPEAFSVFWERHRDFAHWARKDSR